MNKKRTGFFAILTAAVEYVGGPGVSAAILGAYAVFSAVPPVKNSLRDLRLYFGDAVLSSGLNGNMYDLQNNPHLQVRWNPQEVTARGVRSVQTSGFGGELAAGLYVSAEGAKGFVGNGAKGATGRAER